MAKKPVKIAWTIGILTVPPRAVKLKELLSVLEPQLEAAKGKVQVMVLYNNFEKSLGELRQQIVEQANGEYISFIDDDDMVPHDFIKAILPHLDGKNDYIGFRVGLYSDGVKRKPVYHSLRYTDWTEDDHGFYRDITHLNPLKREIALQAKFVGGSGEDVSWANQLRGKAVTEHFIDREMYDYRHSPSGTLAAGPRPGDVSADYFNRTEVL